jgi:hypothetical protein
MSSCFGCPMMLGGIKSLIFTAPPSDSLFGIITMLIIMYQQNQLKKTETLHTTNFCGINESEILFHIYRHVVHNVFKVNRVRQP